MIQTGATNSFVRGIERLNASHKPSVVSIGNFDGLHLGHRHVIKTLLNKSRELDLPSTVVTFEPLAKEFFSPNSVERLTSIEERAHLLFELGVDQVLCVNFDAEFAARSPESFVQDVLIDGLGVRYLSVGDDFRFGKNRTGDFALLQKLGDEHSFLVRAHDTFELDNLRVSSGRVRTALKEGDFTLAERLLGRAYSIQGEVSRGQQMGRTLNFPTANILLSEVLLAVSGVYAVTVEIGGVGGMDAEQFKGVANVGTRPTVDGTEKRLEVYIFDFDRDIYGEQMRVTFKHKVRDEQKFSSLEELKKQIAIDSESARDFFAQIAL